MNTRNQYSSGPCSIFFCVSPNQDDIFSMQKSGAKPTWQKSPTSGILIHHPLTSLTSSSSSITKPTSRTLEPKPAGECTLLPVSESSTSAAGLAERRFQLRKLPAQQGSPLESTSA